MLKVLHNNKYKVTKKVNSITIISYAALVKANMNIVYAIVGFDNATFNFLSTVSSYDIDTDTW